MKKWQIAIPAGIVLAGAGIFAATRLAKKDTAGETGKTAAKTEAKQKGNLATGTYSFVAGYKDATTQEISLAYDKDKCTFSVVEDEFLSYSSDSHVALIYGEDFNMQIEYADYYSGDNFEKLGESLKEKFKGFEQLNVASYPAYRYTDGDSVCYCIPAGASYILITVMPSKDSKETAETLPKNQELNSMLASIAISEK